MEKCSASYYKLVKNNDPRWEPAIFSKILSTRSMDICFNPRGCTQRLRYRIVMNTDLGDFPQIHTDYWNRI